MGAPQKHPPPQAAGVPLTGIGTFAEQPVASQAWTCTYATPLAHSLVSHIPMLVLQRSAVVALPTLITCSTKKHFQITLYSVAPVDAVHVIGHGSQHVQLEQPC